MVSRLHAFVQHAYDFDRIWGDRTVVDDVHRAFHPPHKSCLACMSDMETAKTSIEIRSRVVGPLELAATCRIATASSASYRRRAAEPQRSPLVARIFAISASARRARR